MNSAKVLDREEYIEQQYFFRILRERMAHQLATQEILRHVDDEILATTRLPYAIQFLATELKHSGLLSSGFSRLVHYFTRYQAFVIRQTEEGGQRLSTESALLILEREAAYRAGEPTPAGLFVYQFEALSRNRLGYDDGLRSMVEDPFFDADWREYLEWIRRQIGVVDFADIIYLRSELYPQDQRRANPDYVPPLPPLFGEKEGKIAKANRGRDPLFLFAALQRHLGYPEVPRPRPKDDLSARFLTLQAQFRELENRMKLVEMEIRGQVDLSQLGKPEILEDDDDQAEGR
jgi:hypothetical protein